MPYKVITDDSFNQQMNELNNTLGALLEVQGGQISENVEYGVKWTKGSSSPTLTRVTRYKGVISPWEINFTPNLNGEVTENPFDYISLFNPSIFVDVHGNKFARFKRFYTCYQELGTDCYIWVCGKKLYSFYNLPKAFYKGNVEYWNYVDIAVYEGSDVQIDGSTYLASMPGKIPSHNKNRTTFFNNAKRWNTSLSDSNAEYYLISTMSEVTEILQPLLLIMFATKNTQSIYNGVCSYATSSVAVSSVSGNRLYLASDQSTNMLVGTCITVNESSDDSYYFKISSNGTDSTGFYIEVEGTLPSSVNTVSVRPNFTGDTDNINATHGSNNNDGKASFKCLNIENLYGNIWKNILDHTLLNFVPYICRDLEHWTDTSTPNTNEYFDKVSYNVSSSNGYVKELGRDYNNPDVVLPVDASGSSSTYYCDYYYVSSGAKTTYVGGHLNTGPVAGFFYWFLNVGVSNSSWHLGARLSHRSL